MKYVMKPDPQQVTHPSTGKQVGEPLTMDNFLLDSVLSDQKFGASTAKLAMVIEIRRTIKKYKDKPYIPLENAEYAEVLEVAKAPSTGYNPVLAEPVLVMTKALQDASENDPEEEKKEDSEKSAKADPKGKK